MDFSNGDIVHVVTPEIEYIQFRRLLDFGIVNAYTLRKDGLDFRRTSENNLYSYSLICDKLGIDRSVVTKGFQNHTANVECIDRVMSIDELNDVDGLITDKFGIALSTTNADCNLIMMYDYRKKVIANVHAGWKGTFKKIAEVAIKKMIDVYSRLVNGEEYDCNYLKSKLKTIMWDYVGIIRTKEELIKAQSEVEKLQNEFKRLRKCLNQKM